MYCTLPCQSFDRHILTGTTFYSPNGQQLVIRVVAGKCDCLVQSEASSYCLNSHTAAYKQNMAALT